jgi:peptidoglycan-associated lipoprotein
MRKLLWLLLPLVLLAGCAGQDVQGTGTTGGAPVENRNVGATQADKDRAAREAQLAREREEADRLAEERRRAAMQDQAEVRPLAGTGVGESRLQDPASMVKDPSSPLSKRSIYYEFDSSDVLDEYRPVVEAHAQFLLEQPELKVRIEGNCDERGSTEYNLALGQRRADGVKKALVVLGVPAGRIETVSFGEEKPKALGTDEEAYAQNRRSDIVYPSLDK